MTEDLYNLARFVGAQAPVLDAALEQLRAGRKRGHWMWFVFPQMRGLGRSPTSNHYGIADRKEAEAYLAHPLLSPRLIEATAAVLLHRNKSARAIFGMLDDLKFQSSMTLFAQLSKQSIFHEALDTFFAGQADEATLRLLDQPRVDGPKLKTQ